jgi:hypothetical protein
MWNEEELLKEIDAYFDNTTLEQFLLDVKKANSLDMIEDAD